MRPALDAPEGSVGATRRLLVDADAYSAAAIQKAAYRLARTCSVVVGAPLDGNRVVEIAFASSDEIERARTLERFFRELNDETLRERIGAETKELRAVILAHAFSRSGLLRDE